MAHEYILYVTFVASKIVLRHPKRDASKNMSTPTVSEFDEILITQRFHIHGDLLLIHDYPFVNSNTLERRISFLKEILSEWCHQAYLITKAKMIRKENVLYCRGNNFITVIEDLKKPYVPKQKKLNKRFPNRFPNRGPNRFPNRIPNRFG